MGLPPLEYTDCLLDSPRFREILSQYEKELEENSVYVKQLVKECKRMIRATEEFSKAQCSFAQTLGGFRFQTIEEQTEDEKIILNSLQTFSRLLLSIEDSRSNMLIAVSVRLLQTLEDFRKKEIPKIMEEKRKFDRLTERYYKTLDNNLSISSKKKDSVLTEVDTSLEREQLGFRQCAFDYVRRLQDIHAQKPYELIEPIIGYVSDVSLFLHQAYDGTTAIKPELNAVQLKLQILRDVHLEEQEQAYELKVQAISEGEAGLVHHPVYLRQGHLLVQDNKRGSLGQSWHRYFCQFKKQKERDRRMISMMRFIPVGHHGLLTSPDFVEVKDVVRSRSCDIDRRFCFNCNLVTLKGESHRYVMQASSLEDRRAWLEIMEGKEPVYTSLRVTEGCLTPQGFVFVKKCIEAIEARGLDEEGLYRKPGILSKANKLVKDALVQGKVDLIDLTDEFEWDTKTLASTMKSYFGKHLGAPLLTFDLHKRFIKAAKTPSHSQRVDAITVLVKELPEANRKMLFILMEHLCKVSQHSDKNLMKASNICVVFGPLLMRPERESVETVLDIKYQNIVVEVMIEWMGKIFCSVDATSVVHLSEKRRMVAEIKAESAPKQYAPPLLAPHTRRTSSADAGPIPSSQLMKGKVPEATLKLTGAVSEESSPLEQRLVEAQQAHQNLQRQLNQNILAMQELQRQASETEHHLQNQLDEERHHHKNMLETLKDKVEKLRSQLSSREIDFWTVPRCTVNLDSEIGIGGWGIVSKGTFHGRAVAVKQLHLEIVSEDNVSRLRREVCFMAHVRHPNILLFIAAVFDDRIDRLHPPLIVMELLDIDLRKAYKTDMISQHNLAPIFQDVACALNYLHHLREPIIHRDLSAPNVLLEALADNRWKAKVSDFGSANLAMLAQTAAEGAILYLAPECLPEEIRGLNAPNFPQTSKIDVYSFGVLICEVVTRSLPTQRRQMIAELKSKWPIMHGLADACMNYSPNDRPTMLHIFTELMKTAVQK